ncbi:MAG TPA: hypothetical protein GX509_11530, partial [Firmicutes bacterium]|nr:hypothetical protein [Bacillota bacterium]
MNDSTTGIATCGSTERHLSSRNSLQSPLTGNAVPYLVLFVGILAASSAATLIRLSMAPAVIIAAYRLLIASLILGPVSFGRNREIFTKIGRKDWILCLMTGLILAIHFMTWVLSVKYTS